MIATFKIGKLHVRATLRHRFENHKEPWEKHTMWKRWELGIWLRRYKAVGQKDFKTTAKWGENLVNIYTVGLNLLIAKVWIDIDYGVMHF